ncbi:MAG TPA: NepR family anti-sigma factor [Beijerinckiaceae bacterium]|jgi:hypothetical protein
MRRLEGAAGLRGEASTRDAGASLARAPFSGGVVTLRPLPRAAAADEPAGGPQLDPRCEAYIGEWLKAHYAQILDQPLPDRFAEILSAIDTGGEKR